MINQWRPNFQSTIYICLIVLVLCVHIWFQTFLPRQGDGGSSNVDMEWTGKEKKKVKEVKLFGSRYISFFFLAFCNHSVITSIHLEAVIS